MERNSDAIRFVVQRESGPQLVLRYVREKNYRPAGDGFLEYDSQHSQWMSTHPDPQIQKMAECYVQSYLARRVPIESDSSSSPNA